MLLALYGIVLMQFCTKPRNILLETLEKLNLKLYTTKQTQSMIASSRKKTIGPKRCKQKGIYLEMNPLTHCLTAPGPSAVNRHTVQKQNNIPNIHLLKIMSITLVYLHHWNILVHIIED